MKSMCDFCTWSCQEKMAYLILTEKKNSSELQNWKVHGNNASVFDTVC